MTAALDLLTGPDATDLLEAATATAGGRLLTWRVGQIDHQPDDGTTVAYSARVAWGESEREETLAAHIYPAGVSPQGDPPGALTVSDGESVVRLWCVPHDPELPGLAHALDTAVLKRLLGTATATPQLVAYRPRRRAVVRVKTDHGQFWIKVVRPPDVLALHARHRLLHDAGVPAPHSLGWSDDGLLVLEDLPGTPLRALLRAAPPAPGSPPGVVAGIAQAVSAGGTSGLPGGEQVLAMLGRMPEAVVELPRRRSWSTLSPHYARVIGAALPAEAERATQLAEAVTSGLAGAGPGAEPTHGDFYEGQLMVTGGAITGLLDVDTAGPGHRADDLACALAHLEFLALAAPDFAAGCAALRDDWARAFGSVVLHEELELRTAGVLLTLATGPHRVGRPDWEARTRDALTLVESHLP